MSWGFNNKISAPKKWFSKNVGNIIKYEVNIQCDLFFIFDKITPLTPPPFRKKVFNKLN